LNFTEVFIQKKVTATFQPMKPTKTKPNGAKFPTVSRLGEWEKAENRLRQRPADLMKARCRINGRAKTATNHRLNMGVSRKV
jgi:hypothetical protein